MLVIGFGFMYVNPANCTRSSRRNTTGEVRRTFGWSGHPARRGVVFFAFIGFDAVSTAAQEAKNPQRDMPIGILGSLGHLHGALRPVGARADGSRRSYDDAQRPHPVFVAIAAYMTGARAGWRSSSTSARSSRPLVGHARDAHGPVARVLLDERATAWCRRCSASAPEVPDAVRHDDPHRPVRGRRSPASSRSTSLGEMRASERCSPSSSSAPASGSCAYSARTPARRSGRRSCRSCRPRHPDLRLR